MKTTAADYVPSPATAPAVGDSALRTPHSALAIVGIGCLFPKAAGPGYFWANVKNGVDGITEIPASHWNPDDYFDPDPKSPDMTYARRGGFLDPVPFRPMDFGIPPRDVEATDTSQLLGLVAARQALTDAGLGTIAKRQEKVSVILGVTGTLELVIPLGARLGHPKWKRAMKEAGVPDDAAEDAAARIAASYVPWQENSFPGLLGNVVAGRIANKLDLGGTNCVVDAACASSLSAVHLAALELQAGRSDVVVTGGIDTFNDIFMYMCFSKTPALSPTGDAKPFDADGDGTILGEGLGVVVLKRLADAERDGDTIYAVLKGIGSSSDGKGNAIYAPSAEGQQRCLRTAYSIAGVSPDTVELVEAHGTGTKVGDTVEATGLVSVFGPAGGDKPRPWCAVGSVKSQIGHTKAAAGAASLVKAALALYHKVLPPTIKVKQPVEPFRSADSPFYVNTAARPWLPRAEHPRRAGLSAFGFGGSNFHAVLEEYRPAKAAPDWDGSVEVVALGAATPAALAAKVEALPTAWDDFARAAEESRKAFDPAAPCRLAFAAHRTRTDLPKLVAAAAAKLRAEPTANSWHTHEGVHFGRGAAPGGVAVLFPGQGSQQVGMLRDLACLFPEVLDAVAAANEAVPALAGVRLSDRVYPPTRYDEASRKADDEALRDTRMAQPAIGAVSWGAWRVLAERFGLAPAAFAGHSYGELVALAAAGRLAPADLFTLSRVRGELMAAGRGGDPGSMLAVFAPAAEIDAVVRREKLNLVVANRNAPTQTVLSGATADIERASQAFAAAGLKSARLLVAAAFHSPFVADAAAPLRAALDAVEFAPGTAPVFANTTAAPYPADPAAAKDLLANQLAKPVAFVDEVKALAAAGVRTFVEVGPGAVLTRLAEATLADAGVTDADVFALDASGGKRPGVLDFGNALARLAARGVAVRLAAWEEGSRCRPPAPDARPGLVVPLTGANHVNPRPKLPPRPVTASANGKVPHAPNPTPRPTTTPARGPAMTDPTALAQALSATQQSLLALQRMQEQAAALHRQFLESQEAAQRTLQALVEQQQHLLMGGLGAGVTLPPLPAPAPLPPLLPPVAYTPPAPPVVPAPQPAPAPVVQAPKPAAAAKPVGNREQVERILLDVVAEKTGYPVNSLDLSQGLDSDLGVDSIKRVEILSALQEKLPDAPVVKPEHLGTLHTLQDVADFLAGGATPTADEEEITRTLPVSRDQLLLLSRADGPAPSSAPTRPAADVARTLLEVVAEKTGYPVESLDLRLSLDSDLGVDSIKRVEILSALQEKLPDAPVVKPEHLGTLHTLQDVADFLGNRPAPAAVPPAPATARLPVVPAYVPPADAAPAGVSTLVPSPAELTVPRTEHVIDLGPPVVTPAAAGRGPGGSASGRSPVEVPWASPGAVAGLGEKVDRSILQVADLDVSTPRTRVPLPAGAEVWVVGDPDPLTDGVADRLAGQGYVARVMGWAGPGANRPAAPFAGLVLIAPATPADGGLNRRAFDWLQAVGPKLRQAGRQHGGAVFATVARLDGAFGLNQLSPDVDPTAGGLAGLAKTARHEWPEVSCKAIDLDPAFAGPAAAAALADEVLAGGPVEVGVSATHRCTVELARTVRRPGGQPVGLGPQDVILVTGGARGVTAEAAVALAETFGSTLVLTGRTPAPGAEPDWLAGLTGEAEVKKAIADKLGPDAGPKQIGEQFQKVTAQREVRRTLARVETAGAKVAYYPVDAADDRAVADLLQQVRVKFGPVTAVVHGAGVLADRRIEDLTGDDFDRVYRTKVDGLRNLLDLLAHEDLKALVLFGSMTGRFGRTGQLAYACANEVLNKTAQVEARRRPGCRVVCVNWGPWEGGMVTPGLRKQFEAEGVGLIPLADGATFLVNELSAAGRSVEVLAMGKARSGGSGTVPAPAGFGTATPTPGQAGSGVHPAAPNPDLAPAFERVLDVDTHPVLRSHVLDGRAVLPMALHLEFLAHAALHGHPGLVFHGFNDLRITQGVKLDHGDTLAVRAFAGKATKQDKLFLVPVELRGKKKDGRDVIKSRAEVILVASLPKPPAADRPPAVAPYPHPVADAYRDLLFHGPDLHGIERVDGVAELAITGAAATAPPPADWFQYPLRSQWVADPLVLDSSFQLMILWSRHQHGAASLPNFAGRYRQFRRHFPDGPVTVVARITRDNGTFARADIDYLDADGQVVAQLQDYECMMTDTLNAAFTRNQLGAVKA